MIRVNPRARSHEDRAGDPLDGLVNLFDLGIVLSVAFLLAALSSLNLSKAVTQDGLKQPRDAVTVTPDQTTGPVPSDGDRVIGRGSEVGKVYRLRDGRLVYVVPQTPAPSDGATPGGP